MCSQLMTSVSLKQGVVGGAGGPVVRSEKLSHKNAIKLSNGHSPQIHKTRSFLVRMRRGESHFFKNGLWQMSASLASPSKTGWRMSASLASPSKPGWRMSASLASSCQAS
jgi:hypothetical protein